MPISSNHRETQMNISVSSKDDKRLKSVIFRRRTQKTSMIMMCGQEDHQEVLKKNTGPASVRQSGKRMKPSVAWRAAPKWSSVLLMVAIALAMGIALTEAIVELAVYRKLGTISDNTGAKFVPHEVMSSLMK